MKGMKLAKSKSRTGLSNGAAEGDVQTSEGREVLPNVAQCFVCDIYPSHVEPFKPSGGTDDAHQSAKVP
jgi:hypothetical protein